jgi:hypothetical protein
LSTRDNALAFFSLTGSSSSTALREVARVKRCQSFGETDDGAEVGTEAAPSMEVEKDNLRKLDDARCGMGIETGTVERGELGTPTCASGDAGNDESKREDWDSPYLTRACEPEGRNSVIFSLSRSSSWTLMNVESEAGMIDAVSSLIPRESSNLGCTESRRANWW